MRLDPGYREARQKLYALLIARADRLLGAGEDEAAFEVLMRAKEVDPDGEEAIRRLTAYIPTPVPAPLQTSPARPGPPASTAAPPGPRPLPRPTAADPAAADPAADQAAADTRPVPSAEVRSSPVDKFFRCVR
jgi:hypothetical protein